MCDVLCVDVRAMFVCLVGCSQFVCCCVFVVLCLCVCLVVCCRV